MAFTTCADLPAAAVPAAALPSPEQLNSAVAVLGPTGVALGFKGILYVADAVNSRIATVPFAAPRVTPVANGGGTLTSGGSINSPLGMTLAA